MIFKDGTFSCIVGRAEGESCIGGREGGMLPICPKGSQKFSKLYVSTTEDIRRCNLPEKCEFLNSLQDIYWVCSHTSTQSPVRRTKPVL